MLRSEGPRRSTSRGRRLLFVLALAWPAVVGAQEPPRTVPERTDYERTSTTAEVAAFLDSLQASGAPIAGGRMGTSAEGRPILLVVASDPPVTSPREAARSGKLVIYIQANIHGGEVEGKEAVQLLLRELAGPRRALLKKLIVLVAPVYNPDGNDAFGPQSENRAQQNGPPLVGRRPDGLMLDLNRDYVKAEAPETRASLARVWTSWDPAVMMDLHATNGTRHGYLLTYSPPLNPNGPPGPTAFAQDTMLPAVREAMRQKHGAAVFPYGNVGDPLDPQAWTTYSPLAWYGTNYAGMRGRIGILSEAYSHADFRTRIGATHDFVVEVLEYAAAHAGDIRRVVSEADRRTTLEGRGDLPRPELAVDFEPVSRGVEPVVLERMRAAGETESGRRRLEPTGRLDTVALPVVDRFVATRTETLPAGYLLPAAEHGVVELLRLHGVEVQRLAGEWTGETQTFAIDSLTWADSPFEGHRLLSIRGAWRSERATFSAGTYFVSTAQPLGRLVFELLEPGGYGLARWNLFDRLLGRAEGALSGLVYGSRTAPTFPIRRVERDPAVAMRVVATGVGRPPPRPEP